MCFHPFLLGCLVFKGGRPYTLAAFLTKPIPAAEYKTSADMALLNDNSKTLKPPPPRQQATPQHQSRAVLPDERKTVLRAPPRRIVVVLLPVQEEAGRVVVARQRRARNMVRGRKTARRMAGKQRRRGRISERGSERLGVLIFGGVGVGFDVQELAFWDGVQDGLRRIDIWEFSPPKRGHLHLGLTNTRELGVDRFVWTNVGNIKGVTRNMCHNFHGWCML